MHEHIICHIGTNALTNVNLNLAVARMCISTHAEVLCFIMMIGTRYMFLYVSKVYNAVAVFQTAAVTCIFMWHSVVSQKILCLLICFLKLNDSKRSAHPIFQKKNTSDMPLVISGSAVSLF